MRYARRRRDRFHEGLTVGTEDIYLPVDHRLRRVDPSAVRALTVAEEAIGKRVLPAQVVPVVDVLGEDDDLRSRDRLLAMEPGHDGVRGRTARAPFRGEQLDQDRSRKHGAHTGTLRGTFARGYAILNLVPRPGRVDTCERGSLGCAGRPRRCAARRRIHYASAARSSGARLAVALHVLGAITAPRSRH